jgi:tetratricopeptide (TPR) repeat protein
MRQFLLLILFVLASLTTWHTDGLAQTASAEDRRLIDGYQHKGWVLRNDGRYAEAEACQRKALALFQKTWRFPQESFTMAAISLDIGECLRHEKRYQDALQELAHSSGYCNPTAHGAPAALLSRIHLEQARCYVALEQYAKAQPLLAGVIEQYGNDSTEFHYNSVQYFEVSEASKLLGDCYVGQGNLKLARSSYKKALNFLSELYVPRNSPLRLDVLEAYKSVLSKLGRSEESKRIAQRIEAIHANPENLYPCGTALMEDQKWRNWQP